jgi:hypothetical protein
MKLTKRQKEELKILREYTSITTEGRGIRQNILYRMMLKGLCYTERYGNVFMITEFGKTIKL